LNYFNYFTEIEDAFVRRRGKHLMLSPMDWALIESWKEMDIPLHVALRGIEKAFDSWESKPRHRSVKSLFYCQEEVEAQYAEWREAHVGSGQPPGPSSQNGDSLPFSKTAVLDHVRRGREALLSIEKKRASAELGEALERSAARLVELEEEISTSEAVDSRKLELSLTGIERLLSDVLEKEIDPNELEKLRLEVKQQLKPYKKQMEPGVYQQTFDNLLLKRMRDVFGVPRLSLFYL
jgi:hypothetical protein